MANKILVIVFILFCLELGFFLVIFPWTPYWGNNFFLIYFPFLKEVVLSNFFRGAVSGLGLVDIGIGLWEASHFRIAVAQLNAK